MAVTRPIDINLLPAQYRPRRIRPLQVVLVLVAAALMLGLIPSILTLQGERARTQEVRARIDEAKIALTRVRENQQELEQVEAEIARIREEIAQLQAELATVGGEQPKRARGIAAAVTVVFPGIRLTGITQEGTTLTVEGEAGSQALVLDYARALQETQVFQLVRILSIINTDPSGIAPDVQFSIAASSRE